MDASDASASSGVMIALLPTTSDWCKVEPPHMTLVYAGVKEDMKPGDFNELAKDAASIAMLSSPIGLQVVARETFGENSDVDAFRLRPTPELLAMRRSVESWNASKHTFSPHVTIGPVGTFVEFAPRYITFDRIMAAFGDETITCWLRR